MTSFVSTTCAHCKVEFGLHPDTDRELRRSGYGFKCPYGHALVFNAGPSEEDKLRQERDRLKQNAAYLEDRLRAEVEHRKAAQNQARAQRGVVTRLKNRAAAGVCPCCNRSFAQLRRHMETKHKDFVSTEIAA